MAERKYYNRDLLRNTAVVAALLGAAACSSGESRYTDEASSTHTVDMVPSDSQVDGASEVAIAEQAAKYEATKTDMLAHLESPERASELNDFIDRAGAELISQVQSGEIEFDGLYAHTGEWETISENGFQQGWVQLQTVPDSVGVQFSAKVYTTGDGFDLSKGALSVAMEQVDSRNTTLGWAGIEKPNAYAIASQDESIEAEETFVAVSYQGPDGVQVHINEAFAPGRSMLAASGQQYRTPENLPTLQNLDSEAMGVIAATLGIEPADLGE